MYIIFPTNNSTLDAYAYASSIRYNEDLFLPHHLLYNAFQWVISKILLSIKVNVDILLMTKIINSIFQFFNLYISFRIFKQLKISTYEIFLYILILGFSFSSVRFGTENENYVVPITFSLLASYFYLIYLKNNSMLMIFYSGLFASIACLFHQIHFFWWLGILIGMALYVKKMKAIIYYCITSILIPVIYLIVIYFYNNEDINLYNILHFVFHDYYTGTAKSEIGLNNFKFIFISSIRTFFQVHSVILNLIKVNFLFLLPLFSLPILLFVLIKLLYKKKLFLQNKINTNSSIFYKTHIIIIIFYFLFSFYAVGNIEFLVMIPFLLFISIFGLYKVNTQFLKVFAVSLFIWNFSYGLLANNLLKFYNDEVLVDFITEHQKDVFLVSEHTIINQYTYKTGKKDVEFIKTKKYFNTIEDLKKAYPNKKYIYTDIIQKPQVFNRASFILQNTKLDFYNNRKELIKTYKGLYGKSYIYKVYF